MKELNADCVMLDAECVSIYGRLNAIVCSYFDGQIDRMQDFRRAANLVAKMPFAVNRRFHRFNEAELFELYDALSGFPDRDAEVDRVCRDVERAWKKCLRQRELGESGPRIVE
jgi:hypothetical protein